MKEWDYHPTARRELERAVARYDDLRSGAGSELLSEVEHVLFTNQEHPMPGTTVRLADELRSGGSCSSDSRTR